MTMEVGGSGGVKEMRMFRKQEVQVMAESSTWTLKSLRMMAGLAVGRMKASETETKVFIEKEHVFIS